jgi:hypothetical protein
MRLKLLHHGAEWLAGEFQPPKSMADAPQHVWRVHRNEQSTQMAIKLASDGTGVWDESGRLLHYIPDGADLCWRPKSMQLLSLETRSTRRCQQGAGLAYSLRILEANSFQAMGEIEICLPQGIPNYLILDHQGDQCLATWAGDPETGYVIVELKTMKQLPGIFKDSCLSLSPPELSPNGQFVVSCKPTVYGWWTLDNDEYWDTPSPGGSFEVGIITVHDVESGEITNHAVTVDLPRGWIPDRPERTEWNRIWGPEFVSEREFRIWLPDDSTELLTLPLSKSIDIHREIGAERQWLSDD